MIRRLDATDSSDGRRANQDFRRPKTRLVHTRGKAPLADLTVLDWPDAVAYPWACNRFRFGFQAKEGTNATRHQARCRRSARRRLCVRSHGICDGSCVPATTVL